MNEPQTSYPDFVPNQILTSTQLNDLRRYLDQQDRATRSELIGMGIVCGLTWDVEGTANSRTLTLDGGLGLTSDGWLVCVPATTFHRARAYTDPAVEDNGQTPHYQPWRTSPTGGQRDIIELLAVAPGETAPQGSHVLKQQDLDDRVVVLYVELEPVELRSCFVTECDNKGQKVNVNIRALLVRKSHLSDVPPCEHPLPRVSVPRLHAGTPLSGITRAADIDVGYRAIVNAVTPGLVQRIRQAFDKFGGFLDLEESAHMKPVEEVFRPAVMAGGAINQYHYDAVKEMASAYNEFAAEACELITDCCPQRDFPRHLMLGLDGAERTFRHPFYPAAVRNVIDARTERVRKLFERISTMASAIDFNTAHEVRLTPSATEHESLGARAIPHYYPLSGDAEKTWQPAMCCTSEGPWSYAGSTASGDLEQDAYNRATLIRIEGHRLRACDQARLAITHQRRTHNAEFDVLLTSFDDLGPALTAIRADIEARLTARVAALERYRELIAKAVAKGNFDEAALEEAVKGIDTADGALRELIDRWAETRCGRRLHCDIAHLQMMYADTRSELLCLLSGAIAALAPIVESAAALGDKLPDARRRQLTMIVGVLRDQTRWLLDLALPPRLCAFYYPLFAARYKDLLIDLTDLWLWWRSLGFPVHDEEVDKLVDRPFPAGGEAISAVLLAATRGCFETRLARIWLGYEHVWDNDPSFFPNLVEQVDGLEHLAGVRRCGTFVLVCDRPGAAAELKVQADFSLSCCLPCCCDVDLDKECLPVVALPHYRVVRLRELDNGNFDKVSLELTLEPPGYEPNFRRAGDASGPPLSIKLPATHTRMGAGVHLNADGTVTYTHPEPVAGMLDAFDFILESGHECGGKDRSRVSILMEPEPRVPDVSVPKGGFVDGTVTFNGKRIDSVGGFVRVVEPRIEIPVGVDANGRPGFYRSDALPAGDYHLLARFNDLFSDSVAVHISTGQTTTQNLDLAPRNGAVEVFVVDREGRAIVGSTVRLLRQDRTVQAQSTQPDAEGRHLLAEIPAGIYTLSATASRFVPRLIEGVQVRSRDTEQRKVVLAPVTVRPSDGFVFRVAIERGEDIEVLRERADKLYGTRYQDNEKRIVHVGSIHDVGSSDPYKRAADFFEKAITNKDIPIDVLAGAYLKVADGLMRSVIQPSADPEKKRAMRAVLIDVTGAYFDRVTLDQPDEISTAVARSVEMAVNALRRSEITANAFKTAWKPEVLANELGSKTAVRIAGMIQ